jgi:hypothetical protein
MPKAFTHLCKKVNLSLYDNTLTVYPKPSLALPPIRDELSLLMVLLFSQMDCVSAKVNEFFDMEKNELGIYRFVHRDDSDHNLYHQDSFSLDDNHYHAQFAKSIDEFKLEDILAILEKHALITSEENKSFLSAYHVANKLPHDVSVSKASAVKGQEKIEQSKSITTPSEKVSLKVKDEEPMFAGFKRGFFLTPTSNNSKKEPEQQKNLGLL